MDAEDMLAAGDCPRRFRLRLWPAVPFGWSFGLGIGLVSGGGVPAALAYAKNGERPGRRLGTVAATSSTVIGTLATGVMAWGLRRHPLAVGPGGLRSCDTRGKPVSLPWDMPAAVRPGRAGLMPDLRVDAPGLARPVVVPLRVADPHGFCDAVCEFAGPDHPLTAALRDRLADEGG